jgi:DNA-binding winged helix-turn-helix (wHTH) protein
MTTRFGSFTLDTASRQLRCGDAERHLSTKAFDLLCLLVENRPRALSKAELHERLWPSTYVSDATLSSLVAEVRDALGERAGDRGFLRTVHRFGYAFDGEAIDERPLPISAELTRRCWIVWEHGQVALAEGIHLIGRDGDVAVWLESPTISRHHARLRVTAGSVTIEDLGSKNGTFVHGRRVDAPVRLADSDGIRLGSMEVTVRLVGEGTTTVTGGPP